MYEKHASTEVLSFSKNIHFIKKSVVEIHENSHEIKECKKRGSRKNSPPEKDPPDPKPNNKPNLTLTVTLTFYEEFFSGEREFPDTKKRNHKISYKKLSSKAYDFCFILRRNTLVLALRCYCGDNIKYGFLQNTCFYESTNIPVEKVLK